MKAHLFLIAKRPGRLHPLPPQDDPAWAFVEAEKAATHRRTALTFEQRQLAAHRTAAKVRAANPKMQVRKITP